MITIDKIEKSFIHESVRFGENVVIKAFKNCELKNISIGEDCVFHDNVRIEIGNECIIGKGNVFHNHTNIIGGGNFVCGDHNWIGQKTYIDTSGNIRIGNHNTLGINSFVWTHAGRPSATYINGKNPTPGIDYSDMTIIEDYCWTFPCSQISPGVKLRTGTVVLSGAVVTSSTIPFHIYGGIPSKIINVRNWQAELDKFEKTTFN